MFLRLQFASRHAMWRALREKFWNKNWVPAVWETNFKFGVADYGWAEKVCWDADKFQIGIKLDAKLPPGCFFSFEDLVEWRQVNDNLAEMPLRKAASA